MATRKEMVEAVKSYAEAHYEKGGWDIIVETYTDEELDEALGKVRTVNGAIKRAAWLAGLLGDKRQEIEATAF